jgi:hypothetical protein
MWVFLGGIIGAACAAIAVACIVGLGVIYGWYWIEYPAWGAVITIVLGGLLIRSLRRLRAARLRKRKVALYEHQAREARRAHCAWETAMLNERYGVPGAPKVRRTTLDA